ncbi:MAG: hypothetical protein ACFFC7_15685 [Candidatus Hermodarchaeota archaeon]
MKWKWSLIWILILLGTLIYSSPVLAELKEEKTKQDTWLIDEITQRVDVVFIGYNEGEVDLNLLNSDLSTSETFNWIHWEWNETSQQYEDRIDLKINLDWQFHFATQENAIALDTFVDNNSWSAATSALNTTALNLQEETGERMSIFYPQMGTAINGTAVNEYLASHKTFDSEIPSYSIYFLNFSRFDTEDHSQEHWFEIDETDPDSNNTVDWWRLEWDNDLNPDVKYPYPALGFRNHLFFIDPYCHQWYTKWTNIWWNSDEDEENFDYRVADLDSYLAGQISGTSAYRQKLALYLSGWLNDVVWDTAGRADGFWKNEQSISVQLLMLNDALSHGYTRSDLEWFVHEDVLLDELQYIVPLEVANITIEITWANLTDFSDLETIVNDNIMGAEELSGFPWYRPDWTYLDGGGISSGFRNLRSTYFDLSSADATFTAWFLLLQNVSMVYFWEGEWHEFTALGGGGNVISFKDLNRFFESDGITPRSGSTNTLVHEVGHVLGLGHAESWSDASQGAGGYMRDTMSYYSNTPKFSIFTRDSLYRTSSIIARQLASETIEAWRVSPDFNITISNAIDDLIAAAKTAFDSMNYLNAFLNYRQLYDFVDCLKGDKECPLPLTTYPTSTSTNPTSTSTNPLPTIPTSFPAYIFLFSLIVIAIWYRRQHRKL